jgi:hypothetical protein
MPLLNVKTNSAARKVWDVLIILGLFLLGVIIIGFTLNWGGISFDILDWSQEGPRLLFLQQALKQGKPPLFIDSPMIETSRFLGIPDTLFAPQIFLLHVLPLGKFVLVNTLLNYAAGFFILRRIKIRLGWSMVPFIVAAPLALLNGFILSHIAVGHTMWVNAFLMPWLVLLYLSLPREGIDWGCVLHVSLFSLVIVLQGGFHFALWSWGFLLLVGLQKNKSLKTVLLSILFSVLTSLIRILPASMTFFKNDRRFIAGFRTLHDLLRSLIQLQLPEEAQAMMNSGLPNWETNFYIGLLGGLFILFFAVGIPLLQKEENRWYLGLWTPLLILTVLSIGQVFRLTNLLPFGLAHAERVSSRFFFIPLLFLIVIAGDTLNQWLGKRFNQSRYWLFLLGAEVILMHDLIQHARFWRVDRLATIFDPLNVPLIGNVLSQSDPAYLTALSLGASVSLISLISVLTTHIFTKDRK